MIPMQCLVEQMKKVRHDEFLEDQWPNLLRLGFLAQEKIEAMQEEIQDLKTENKAMEHKLLDIYNSDRDGSSSPEDQGNSQWEINQ